jgi:hypothetical protein
MLVAVAQPERRGAIRICIHQYLYGTGLSLKPAAAAATVAAAAATATLAAAPVIVAHQVDTAKDMVDNCAGMMLALIALATRGSGHPRVSSSNSSSSSTQP